MIQLPDKCLRDLSTCEPLSQIALDCGGSLMCVGCNDGSDREYTLCIKNDEIDDRIEGKLADLTISEIIEYAIERVKEGGE